jgi:hypothetical protein
MKNHELDLKNRGKISLLDTDPTDKHEEFTKCETHPQYQTRCSFFEMKSYFHFFTQWSLEF